MSTISSSIINDNNNNIMTIASPSERDNLIMKKWEKKQTAANTNVFLNNFAWKLELGLKHVLCVLIRVLKIDREWSEWNSQSRKDWKMPNWIWVWLAAFWCALPNAKSLFFLSSAHSCEVEQLSCQVDYFMVAQESAKCE